MVKGQLPRKLARPTVVQALAEIRFDQQTISEDVIPGLLYGALRGTFPMIETAQLPPVELRRFNPQMQYLIASTFVGPRGSVGVGAQSLLFTAPPVYPGWTSMKETIAEVVEAIQAISVFRNVIRFSMKYTNIFPGETTLKKLNFSWNLGTLHPPITQEAFRFENREDDFIDILSLATGVTHISTAIPPVSGALLDIDVIKENQAISFDAFSVELLEACHDRAKSHFFDALKEETLLAMGPE